jgi:hypothetical protein
MKLLFKRSQSSGRFGQVQFRLWAKIEFDGDEQVVVAKYRLAEAVLIAVLQEKLIRNSALVGLGGAMVAWLILSMIGLGSIPFAVVIGAGGGYYYFHQKRETIYVKDLSHGRYFTCNSVIELAQKEEWLKSVVAFFRQVMESAKYWDGTETVDVPVLDKEAARLLIAGL